MLERLATYDEYFRQVARRISPQFGDDFVNDMYLRLHALPLTFDTDNHLKAYAVLTIRRMNIDQGKKPKNVELQDEFIVTPFEKFECGDTEKKVLDSLNFVERELLSLCGEMSLRKIGAEYNLNYQFVNRTIKDAKKRASLIAS